MGTEYHNFNQADISKFNTCLHRSDGEISEVRRSCCTSFTVKGFKCNLLAVFPLEPHICQQCLKFEPKLPDSISSGAV